MGEEELPTARTNPIMKDYYNYEDGTTEEKGKLYHLGRQMVAFNRRRLKNDLLS